MRSTPGGVERWARELSFRLPAIAPGRYRFTAPRPGLSGAAGQAWEQLVLPGAAARGGAEMILCPANLAPLRFGGNVVVIHDAAALREPGWYSPAYARWQAWVLPRVVEGARAIITPSAFSRDEIVELAGADPGKITVVPGGVDSRFSPGAPVEPARRAFGLERPYVLTVAGRTARKNLSALGPLAEALAGAGIDVVAAGSDRRELRAGSSPAGVRQLGRVDDALLPGLYAGAAAFVLPSFHEGFGLTALEAMSSGLPVVASPSGGLPEVCGDAATWVEPGDAEALAGAVIAACGQEKPSAASLESAAGFSWEATARGVDAVVAGLLGG